MNEAEIVALLRAQNTKVDERCVVPWGVIVYANGRAFLFNVEGNFCGSTEESITRARVVAETPPSDDEDPS